MYKSAVANAMMSGWNKVNNLLQAQESAVTWVRISCCFGKNHLLDKMEAEVESMAIIYVRPWTLLILLWLDAVLSRVNSAVVSRCNGQLMNKMEYRMMLPAYRDQLMLIYNACRIRRIKIRRMIFRSVANGDSVPTLQFDIRFFFTYRGFRRLVFFIHNVSSAVACVRSSCFIRSNQL